MYIITHR